MREVERVPQDVLHGTKVLEESIIQQKKQNKNNPKPQKDDQELKDAYRGTKGKRESIILLNQLNKNYQKHLKEEKLGTKDSAKKLMKVWLKHHDH